MCEISRKSKHLTSHLILPGSHLDEMKLFHRNKYKWASSVMWERVFFNAHVYVLLCHSFQIRFQHGYNEYQHDHS